MCRKNRVIALLLICFGAGVLIGHMTGSTLLSAALAAISVGAGVLILRNR